MDVAFLTIIGCLLLITMLFLAYLVGERAGKALARYDIKESERRAKRPSRKSRPAGSELQWVQKTVRKEPVQPAHEAKPRLVASMGKPIDLPEKDNVIRADFRNKKKVPDDPGPKGAA